MSETPSGLHKRERWERRTQGPLLALSLLFAAAYAVPIVLPDSDPWVREAGRAVEWGVWAAFAVDLAIRLHLSPWKLRFLRENPLAVLAVALPLLQPLRLLRLVSGLLLAGHRARLAAATAQIRLTTYVAGSCAGLLLFGSLAVLEVERNSPEGNIRTFGDAVWWSFTTMTTVGYGDLAPTTGLGRVLAVGLMLSGIALLGVVTANIAAWFISQFDREKAEEQRQTAAIDELTAEVRALRAELAAAGEGRAAVPEPAGRNGGGPGVSSPRS
ncbi:potassium channel family protein [Streptomyces sp. MNU89]|uniref:potassium channel family protein n=1 Tax=Streptomyces sp. MNU89 TaxID=2560025 RepID=UPI001E4266F3|nr:potassium channel family protein [Streptomyces sp. MNU89]MCC9741805.1 potassium channel family protein [Streptomyces sp. MNU89]